MECYIVRIYRRADETPPMLAGIVEKIGEDKVRTFNFRTTEELVEIVTGSDKENPKGKGRRKGGEDI